MKHLPFFLYSTLKIYFLHLVQVFILMIFFISSLTKTKKLYISTLKCKTISTWRRTKKFDSKSQSQYRSKQGGMAQSKALSKAVQAVKVWNYCLQCIVAKIQSSVDAFVIAERSFEISRRFPFVLVPSTAGGRQGADVTSHLFWKPKCIWKLPL